MGDSSNVNMGDKDGAAAENTPDTWLAPHLKLAKGSIPEFVLVAGDPFRIQSLAALCDDSEEVAYNREYRTFVGTFQGKRLAMCSHGIGTAGAAICFEELVQCGAKTIVRLGTCGGLQSHISQGDMIVAIAAAREDGTTKLMAPVELPAVADPDTVATISQVCDEQKVTYHKGVILTSDLFYPSKLPGTLKLYSECGVLGVEMEMACLFMVAQLRGIKAAACAVVDGNPLQWDDGDYDPHGEVVTKAKKDMLMVGLHIAAKLAQDGESPKKRQKKK